jgi:sterol desaturase/sphingolipid hydroxylase (fatty acid hydroxylase superfamily)
MSVELKEIKSDELTNKCVKSNKISNKKYIDYVWISTFYIFLISISGFFFTTTTKEDCDKILYITNSFNISLENKYLIYLTYYFTNIIVLKFVVCAIWNIIKYVNYKYKIDTSVEIINKQIKPVNINIILLSLVETLWLYFILNGYTKVTIGNNNIYKFCSETTLWMLCFELTWYVQHRLMHENYFLWRYGHAYHHTWNKSKYLIGITNFARDHFVEVIITMISSFVPILLFPINYYNKIFISLVYLILSFLVHWDLFPYKYHSVHHFNKNYNYGTHIPIFDIFFNTYYWGDVKQIKDK